MSPPRSSPSVGGSTASSILPIMGVPTAATLFIGWARRGTTKKACKIVSWADYVAKFGTLDPKSDLGYAVNWFFANGGSDAHVIRLKAPTRRGVMGPSDPAFQHAVLAQFEPGGHAAALDFFSLVCVPGLTDQATLATLMAKVAARRAFLIVDCPSTATTADVVDTIWQGPGQENAAFYFPWVRAVDPKSGAERLFPPSGFICGIYSRTDSRVGVWKSPAGMEAMLNGARGIGQLITDAQNGPLNARAINCLRHFPSAAPVVWGARTLAGRDDQASDWKYVPVRRLALFIEQSLIRGLQWTAAEPNDEALWAQIRLTVSAFMQNLFRQGAFKGQSARDAYFVKCDRDTTPATAIAAGTMKILVGFAPLKPAEFITLGIDVQARPSGP